jgi:fumarate reductase flavoprotein subunit
MPAPIAKAPFYAIRLQGTSSTSTVGLAINDDLQVIRTDGTVVPGLYAVGELLGSGQLMGSSFCGGMMGTPALTFGRLLGQRLLHWAP